MISYAECRTFVSIGIDDGVDRLYLCKCCGRVGLTSSQLCLVQPFGQDGLEFAGVLEAQLQVFEATDGGLAELGAVHCS